MAATALAHPLQDLAAVSLRKVEVEDQHRGARYGRIAIGLFDELDGLLAVHGELEIGIQPRFFDRFSNQERVGAVVFGNQDPDPLPSQYVVRRGR